MIVERMTRTWCEIFPLSIQGDVKLVVVTAAGYSIFQCSSKVRAVWLSNNARLCSIINLNWPRSREWIVYLTLYCTSHSMWGFLVHWNCLHRLERWVNPSSRVAAYHLLVRSRFRRLRWISLCFRLKQTADLISSGALLSGESLHLFHTFYSSSTLLLKNL
jgi:hypothetical protein